MTKTSWFYDRTRLEVLKRLEVMRTSLQGFRTSKFPGEQSHDRDQEPGRVGAISNMLIFC